MQKKITKKRNKLVSNNYSNPQKVYEHIKKNFKKKNEIDYKKEKLKREENKKLKKNKK